MFIAYVLLVSTQDRGLLGDAHIEKVALSCLTYRMICLYRRILLVDTEFRKFSHGAVRAIDLESLEKRDHGSPFIGRRSYLWLLIPIAIGTAKVSSAKATKGVGGLKKPVLW